MKCKDIKQFYHVHLEHKCENKKIELMKKICSSKRLFFGDHIWFSCRKLKKHLFLTLEDKGWLVFFDQSNDYFWIRYEDMKCICTYVFNKMNKHV
jgi:hypothetical protein